MNVIDIFRFPIVILQRPIRCPSNPFSLHRRFPSTIQRRHAPLHPSWPTLEHRLGEFVVWTCSYTLFCFLSSKMCVCVFFYASGSLRSSLRQWICTHITREPRTTYGIFIKFNNRVSQTRVPRFNFRLFRLLLTIILHNDANASLRPSTFESLL
jgi:hypothetical protein